MNNRHKPLFLLVRRVGHLVFLSGQVPIQKDIVKINVFLKRTNFHTN